MKTIKRRDVLKTAAAMVPGGASLLPQRSVATRLRDNAGASQPLLG